MTYREFFALLDETGLSPERAAKRLGVSNMTLRRWRSRPGRQKLSAVHERAFAPVFEEWAADGTLSPRGKAAVPVGRSRESSFRSVLTSLGFPADVFAAGPGDEQALLAGLSKVGDDPARRRRIDRGSDKLAAFGAMGREWKERVFGLLHVVRSNELLTSEKLVAYGALFYLLTPLDLIPDTVPAVGLLDDFALLGLALLFYRGRFPKVFGR